MYIPDSSPSLGQAPRRQTGPACASQDIVALLCGRYKVYKRNGKIDDVGVQCTDLYS